MMAQNAETCFFFKDRRLVEPQAQADQPNTKNANRADTKSQPDFGLTR